MLHNGNQEIHLLIGVWSVTCVCKGVTSDLAVTHCFVDKKIAFTTATNLLMRLSPQPLCLLQWKLCHLIEKIRFVSVMTTALSLIVLLKMWEHLVKETPAAQLHQDKQYLVFT